MSRVPLSNEAVSHFQDRLCGVAAGLFAERGFEGVTLRAVAARIGCSPMTPYRYFQDKAALFAAVRAEAYGRFADAQEAARREHSDTREKLAALGGAYIRFACDHPDAYRLMFELAQPDPEGYPELRTAEARAWRPLRETVGDAIEAGFLAGDPDALAHVFWASLHGLVSLHLAGKLALGCSLDELGPAIFGSLLRGGRVEETA